MTNDHIIIIGAGAAGLMAAKVLSEGGKSVTILEARDYLGGRIHTTYGAPFVTHAELGAEFVHGNLPLTIGLLKEANIPYHETGGEMWQAKNGALKQEYHQIEYWNLFEQRLKALKEDQTLTTFLEENFSGAQYAALRESAIRYVSGYDTADPDKASAFALRDEWLNEDDDDEQHRPTPGYQPMITYLADTCIKYGCSINKDTVVKQINWQQDKLSVITKNGATYSGNKVIITVPLGVLQAEDNEEGAICYTPPLPEIKSVVHNMAIGAIIKILMQFSEPFWGMEEMTAHAGKSMEHLGFIFSEEIIPTFWTQYPNKNNLLTGWLGGPKAAELKDVSDDHILDLAIESLSFIFKMTPTAILCLLKAASVVNWTADVYSRGSYSYATINTPEARKIMNTPIADTVYFSGEALYEGPEMGTVEAALASGKNVAEKILTAY